MITKKTKLINNLLKMNKSSYTFDDIKRAWWNLTNPHKTPYVEFNHICSNLNTSCKGYHSSSYGYLTRPSDNDYRYIKRVQKNTYVIL